MDKRNIQLSLEEAKKLYNNGDSNMKSLILTSFTEEELTAPNFTDIKTFEDACKALGISNIRLSLAFTGKGNNEYDHLQAILRLDIIRKALNGDWKPSLTQGDIYYPIILSYPADQTASKAASHNDWTLGKSFIVDGQRYILVAGDYCRSISGKGISNFGHGFGNVRPDLGLLGCKSKEIAQHMSRYFSKEIFEAIYSNVIEFNILT